MEINKVLFYRNAKAKRYIIRIMPDQSIRVTIPKYGTEQEARQFLNDNIEKLHQKIDKNPLSIFEFNTNYQSKFYTIKIIETSLDNNVDIINRNVIIRISKQFPSNTSNAQDYIAYILTQILRKEAKLYIPKKVMEYANIHHFKVNDIKINSARTRWGSCSGKNNLNFSLFLMQLPYELIDYVILHELAHTIHKNHSSDFYRLLNQLSKGQHQRLNKQLKQFSPRIKAEYFQKIVN